MIEPDLESEFELKGDAPFRLEAGGALSSVTLRYAMYGKLNEKRDNAILVCHALSGSARVADWWGAMFGANQPFDATRCCIIGIGAIGSPYNSTSPLSINPQTQKPYGRLFPVVTIRDIVRAQAKVVEHLRIERLRAVIGGSIGGMQALEWAIAYPAQIANCIAVAATPLSAMGLALNHLQRRMIELDKTCDDEQLANDKTFTSSGAGLALARALAMCSYKSSQLFDARFNRQPNRTHENPLASLDARFDVAGYLDYQGAKFIERFDADSYLYLTKAMDSFDFARDGLSEHRVFQNITARLHLIGISTDWLFPARDVRALVERLRAADVNVTYSHLESAHGHDAFLADAHLLAPLVNQFINHAIGE